MNRLGSPALALTLAFACLISGCGGGGPSTTYSVGGTLGGLTAAGLTLSIGAETVSPSANATSFTFPTALASGTAYSVTVSSQPAGQTCIVSQGSGTVAAAAVATVQVVCTTTTYAVGGSISALTANGLVLANGAATVSPAANATTFSFATKVPAGTAYAVTVTTQPAGLNCTVGNGSGTVANATVSSVTVSCAIVPPPPAPATWTTSNLGAGIYPVLASDPSGAAFFLAWCQCTGSYDPVTVPSVASRFTDAGAWSSPAAMAFTNGTVIRGMGFDAQGKGFAVWQNNNSGAVSAYYSRYTPTGGWTALPAPFGVALPPQNLPANSSSTTAERPFGLAVFRDGSARVLVQEDVRIGTGINPTPGAGLTNWQYPILLGGAAAGGDILSIGPVDPGFPGTDVYPSTIKDANGNDVPYWAVITTLYFDPVVQGSTPGSFGAIYVQSTQQPVTLSSGSPGLNRMQAVGLVLHTASGTESSVLLGTAATFPSQVVGLTGTVGVTKNGVAIADDGTALVAWSLISSDTHSLAIYAQRFDGSAWQAPQVLYTSSGVVQDYTSYPSKPVVALNAQGNGMVVFSVLGQLTTVPVTGKSSGFGSPVVIAPQAATHAVISLAMDAAGNAFLLDNGYSVRRYDAAGNVWAAPALSFAADPAQDPSLVLDKNGGPMVAWMNGNSIYASRYH